MGKVRVVLYGVGAVGSSIVKFLLQKEGVEVVGAIDVAEDKYDSITIAQPSLVTMKDLPIPSAVLKDMRKYIC